MKPNEPAFPYGQNSPATVVAGLLLAGAAVLAMVAVRTAAIAWGVIAGVLALAAILLPLSLLIARQWEKAVVLRFGKLHAIRGPGLFAIVPFVDSVTAWVDQRIQTI